MGAIVPYAKQAVRQSADGLFVFPEPRVAAVQPFDNAHPSNGGAGALRLSLGLLSLFIPARFTTSLHQSCELEAVSAGDSLLPC